MKRILSFLILAMALASGRAAVVDTIQVYSESMQKKY